MPTSKPKRGRPPKRAAERRRHILSIRVTSKLRDLLVKAAQAEERSISQEVERRIERSFEREALAIDIAQESLAQMDKVSAMIGAHSEALKLAAEILQREQARRKEDRSDQ